MAKLQIPGYELLGQLRPGLHSARELSTRRACTLRVLGQVDATRQQRIEEIGPRLRRLEHPNLGAVYELGMEGGSAWIAEELVGGAPLGQLLEALGGQLEVGPALAVAVQIGRALGALKQAELLHQGISPDTIVITPEGQARLSGLGLSLEADVRERITAGTISIEAVDYMSPELIEGEPDTVTSKCDVYGLGATLFRCLAGRSPYGGTTLFTRLRAVWSDEPPDLRTLRPDLPDLLARLVWRLMERDADDRPLAQDVAQLASQVAQQLGARDDDWEQQMLGELVAEVGELSRAGRETDVAELADSSDAQIQILLRGKDESFSRTLAQGDELDVGRSSDASVCLPFRWVSRQHARIVRTPEGFLLTDLGSANGTVHNGARVNGSVALRTGDVISFGKSNFEVSFSRVEQARPEQTAPTWTRCRRCGQDLDTAVRTSGSAVCAACREKVEVDQSEGEERVREALEQVGFQVQERVPWGGLLQRYRATSKAGSWLLEAAELGPPAARAFAAASQAIKNLAHPSLLQAKEVLVQGGTLIVAYPPHRGETLERTVQERGPIDHRAALHLGSCLADALSCALRAGVRYVLVRPGLVVFDDDGNPRLLQVGLAPGLVEAQRTRVGLTAIEPCYEAPELGSGRAPSERSLIYALGATLCYAMTGSPVAEVRGGDRREHLRLGMVESLPRQVAFLLARMTSPDPGDRPGHLEELGRELSELAEQGAGSGAAASEDAILDAQSRTQQIDVEDLPPELRG